MNHVRRKIRAYFVRRSRKARLLSALLRYGTFGLHTKCDASDVTSGMIRNELVDQNSWKHK